jgi:hypothetical protein
MFDKKSFVSNEVEFVRLPGMLGDPLKMILENNNMQALDQLLDDYAESSHIQPNMVFNFPREQYSKLDRGETPEAINAAWFTLSNQNYSNPSIQTVSGETFRVAATTQAADPANPRNSIIRFILDVGQFIGAWSTAILIGGSDATGTPGTGKIVAAVNNVRDDANTALNRDGTTIHLVNWKLKHLDISEA